MSGIIKLHKELLFFMSVIYVNMIYLSVLIMKMNANSNSGDLLCPVIMKI